LNRMWKSIMLPIIEHVNAKYIVEIGSDRGTNTKNILDYCIKNDAKMVAIDPFPRFDVEKFKKDYGNKFNIYEDLSLNILPSIENFDVIIVDGDHNWYTVYNELKIIEKSFKEKKFPLVFLHDISWPYGRRDLYYNPDNIPEKYRNPFEKNGVQRGSSFLVKNGFNKGLNNAILDKTPKNGVLTAIEDFLRESPLELSFMYNNAFWGLGIIFHKNISKETVNKYLNSMDLINDLEKERVDNQLKYTEKLSEIEKLNELILKLKNELNQCLSNNQNDHSKQSFLHKNFKRFLKR
jgi:methyltransferase family protein